MESRARVCRTGKAFDDILTGDHGASQSLEMSGEQDFFFQSVHREMVQVGNSCKTLNESIIHSSLFQLQPISSC